MTKVLFLSPGYPQEMPFFVRGLARAGAHVFGLGDAPEAGVDPQARRALSGYLRASSLWNEETTVPEVLAFARARGGFDRVECLWEPGMSLAARLREALGCPGMGVEQTAWFRDKEQMKQVVDAAGIRTPRHERATSEAEVRAAAERIGYPLIVKPIAGAGSADTYRVDSKDVLEKVLPRVRHVREASVEEFIEGEEYTFDTICAGGRVLFENVCWYRPKPLIARSHEWISPQTVALRDLSDPDLACGIDLGRRVLEAMRFRDGYTHMEWFRTPKGEAVFGEIAARPPGARTVDLMNFACDFDAFDGWAEAVLRGTLSQERSRKFNAISICKRAKGEGTIRRIEGLDAFLAANRRHVAAVALLPVGARRRDWLQTLLSDGYVVVRHEDLGAALHMADRFASDVHLYAA